MTTDEEVVDDGVGSDDDKGTAYVRFEFTEGETRWSIQAYRLGWMVLRNGAPPTFHLRLAEAARSLADHARREMPADLVAVVRAQEAFVASLVQTTATAVAGADPDELPEGGANGERLGELGMPRKAPAPRAPRAPRASGATKPAVDPNTLPGPADVVFEVDRDGAHAECVLRDGQFVVTSGSTACAVESVRLASNLSAERKKLRASGALVPDGTFLRATRDIAFKSSSAAGSIVTGVGFGGPSSWRVKGTSVTMREWDAVHGAKR